MGIGTLRTGMKCALCGSKNTEPHWTPEEEDHEFELECMDCSYVEMFETKQDWNRVEVMG